MDCAICLSLLERVKQLACGHEFCGPCIRRWVRMNPTCPTCREPVVQVSRNRAPQPIRRNGSIEVRDSEPLPTEPDTSPEVQLTEVERLVTAAHESFFMAVEFLIARGSVSRDQLSTLGRHLRDREAQEPENLGPRGRLIFVNRNIIPEEMRRLHTRFPEFSLSHAFALDIMAGRAFGFLRTVPGCAPRRLYRCVQCRTNVFSMVEDFIEHLVDCQRRRREEVNV